MIARLILTFKMAIARSRSTPIGGSQLRDMRRTNTRCIAREVLSTVNFNSSNVRCRERTTTGTIHEHPRKALVQSTMTKAIEHPNHIQARTMRVSSDPMTERLWNVRDATPTCVATRTVLRSNRHYRRRRHLSTIDLRPSPSEAIGGKHHRLFHKHQ